MAQARLPGGGVGTRGTREEEVETRGWGLERFMTRTMAEGEAMGMTPEEAGAREGAVVGTMTMAQSTTRFTLMVGGAGKIRG